MCAAHIPSLTLARLSENLVPLNPTDRPVAIAMAEMHVCLTTGEMGKEESGISSHHLHISPLEPMRRSKVRQYSKGTGCDNSPPPSPYTCPPPLRGKTPIILKEISPPFKLILHEELSNGRSMLNVIFFSSVCVCVLLEVVDLCNDAQRPVCLFILACL